MRISINMDVEELMAKLSDMMESGYDIIKTTIELDETYDNSVVELSASNTEEHETVDYGFIQPYDDYDLI